jgi:hypothetical protein
MNTNRRKPNVAVLVAMSLRGMLAWSAISGTWNMTPRPTEVTNGKTIFTALKGRKESTMIKQRNSLQGNGSAEDVQR